MLVFVPGWIFLFLERFDHPRFFFCLARLNDVSCECKGKENIRETVRTINQFCISTVLIQLKKNEVT